MPCDRIRLTDCASEVRARRVVVGVSDRVGLDQAGRLDRQRPSVGATYNNMAIVLQSQGQLERAMVMYEKVLAISVKSLGPDHPSD